ncbi:unnamed protein product [Didymodactylos carnosus]|uniref:Cation-transporting P-type ATPase N-terminal domain-containing protein n=1 Tax=Didymodactylos carnosus TaxID=1234261 RepID=A0A814Q7H6_9BILA|nr:unnamed protein product [Didymodactylos carnosus]CAF3880012.1 unnamed protein product [Didymodactylos carnosus]
MGKDTTKEGGGADDTHSGNVGVYQITVDQLQELMELHGKELIEKLNASYGGMKGLLEKLKVDGQKGLQSDNKQDLEKRRQIFGKNEIPPKPMRSFLYLCCQALLDKKLIILLICAVVSIGFSWLVSVAILAVVLVVIFVTGLVDWRRERHFRVMQSKFDKDLVTSVVRDNKIQQIPIQELVVGDLCFIKYGDLLPADGLIVQASDLQTDESSLTGETDLIKKNDKENIELFSGTSVMEGSGRMVVVGVGLNSQAGRIVTLLRGDSTANENKAGEVVEKEESKDKHDIDTGTKDDKSYSSLLSQRRPSPSVNGAVGRLTSTAGMMGTSNAFSNLLFRRSVQKLQTEKKESLTPHSPCGPTQSTG